MKSIKNILVVLLVLVSGVCYADVSGCDSYDTEFAIERCNRQWVLEVIGQTSRLTKTLYRDSNNLGLTQQEKDSVFQYVSALDKDVKIRCKDTEWDCYHNAYKTAYQELKAFEETKIQEKQARMASVAKPTFTPGKVQPAPSSSSNKLANRTPAEIARDNEAEYGD